MGTVQINVMYIIIFICLLFKFNIIAYNYNVIKEDDLINV